MSKKRSQFRKSPTPCAYCGAPSSTRDHVVPESLFHGYKYQLVTVRACFACNQKKKEFDTFLRDFLAVDARVHRHQAAEHNFTGPFARAARRGQSELAKYVQRSARPTELITPSGILVWQGSRAVLNNGEVEEAVRYIVRGLTYYHAKERIEPTSTINVQLLTPKGLAYAWQWMHDLGGVNGPMELGDEVIRWVFLYADANASAWLIAFYTHLVFLVTVRSIKLEQQIL